MNEEAKKAQEAITAFIERIMLLSPVEGKKNGATGWAAIILQTYGNSQPQLVEGTYFAVGDINLNNLTPLVRDFVNNTKAKSDESVSIH